MALSDYQPERREVIVNGKPLFSVEGLSFDGLEKLVRTHVADMEGVFDLILVGEKPSDTLNASLASMALALVTKAPGLAANIIAIASGEEITDQLIASARRLPFPNQVEALVTIGELTFEENGGVKKSVESLFSLLSRLRAAGTPMKPETQTTRKPLLSGSTTESVAT